jgi:hypothetical protein
MKLKSEFLIVLYMFAALALCIGRTAKADALSYEHDWAHFGTSFAIQTVAYGVTTRVLKVENPFLAALISGTITFAGTSAYELYKTSKYGSPLDTHAMGMNALGIGTSIGTCFLFNF